MGDISLDVAKAKLDTKDTNAAALDASVTSYGTYDASNEVERLKSAHEELAAAKAAVVAACNRAVASENLTAASDTVINTYCAAVDVLVLPAFPTE